MRPQEATSLPASRSGQGQRSGAPNAAYDKRAVVGKRTVELVQTFRARLGVDDTADPV